MGLTNLLQSLKAVFGLILQESVTLSDLELPILLHHLFYPPQTPVRALISAHFKPSQPFSLPPATWAVPHINSMKCRVGPLTTKPSPPRPGSDTTTKIHNILPTFPRLQGYRQGCHQGPQEEGKRSQNERSYRNKLLCSSPCVSPKLQIFSSSHAGRAVKAEQESGTPRTPAREFLCKKPPTAFTSWSQTSFQRLDRRDVFKTCPLVTISTVYNPFLVYTHVFIIYTHLVSVGNVVIF